MADRHASTFLASLRELTLARIREFLREPEAVFWVFGFPVIMTIALGIAFRSRTDEPVIVAVERAAGAGPRAPAPASRSWPPPGCCEPRRAPSPRPARSGP